MAEHLTAFFKRGLDFSRSGSSKFWNRTREMIFVNWHLGLTAFGGPAVHYQLVRKTIILIQPNEELKFVIPCSSMKDL